MKNTETIWNVFPPDVGNRITELSKVIGQLHTEMKHIQENQFDHLDNPKGDPSAGSSFLGKYILGAKNNFKGFNSNERKTVPLHEPILHEEPAETVEEEDEESPTAETEPDRKSNKEQNSEGETDNAVEDMNETEGGEDEGDVETGNDDVIEISMEGEEDGEKNTSETVIDIDSNTDAESEASGKTEDEMIAEEASDNVEELNTDEATGGANLNEAETEENGEVEESNGTIDDINEDVVEVIDENEGEGIKIDLNQTNLVSFLAKRIEEKLEKNFTFIGNQASSPTGSDDSQDTGFGSQEFDLSTSSP